MPSRVIREGILDSEAVNSLSPQAEVFYRRLMNVVDDFGRFDGRVAVLRGRLYALQLDKVREADVVRWIAECVKANLVRLYESNGKPYLLFHKLGEPRAKLSKYPPPTDADTCEQTRAAVYGCAQTQADVPYSGSGSESNTDSDSSPGAGGVSIPPELDTAEFREAWAEWKADRKARKVKPYTPKGEKLALKQLVPLGPEKAIETVNRSIANGWQGLFPENAKPPPKPPGNHDGLRDFLSRGE